jgi:1-acyl-sn-glycerol-3-phosphate acyltransferase
VTTAVGLPLRWAVGLRHRQSPTLDHSRLRWYREPTATYRFTADHLLPAVMRLLADGLVVDGLANVPTDGPVILAANHRDNLDPYLLLHLVPRTVHIAARPDAFGTGGLCAVWRRLGAFPADAWGVRHALALLAEGDVVGVFPQARISQALGRASGAAGVLALRSGAPVVPIAISGTEAVRALRPFSRPRVHVRFGAPITFERGEFRSLEVADQILQQVAALLPAQAAMTSA